ncbi:EAL domain-containing protein [Vibrio sp. F74]|uniref:EAL domain-containing protein n=1 Tax=Vibrio sp. F74 TaxID=700020 RepID=UPI0035F5DBD0
MELFTPTSIQRLFQLVEGEWVAHYKGDTVRSVFQPILKKSLTEVYGYEGLVRITRKGAVINPTSFFENFTDDTELTNVGALCCSLHLRNFSLANLSGKVFLNTHPTMFSRIASDEFSINKVLERITLEGVSMEQVIWEITEFKESNTDQFVSGIASFRKAGNQVAIGDYGQKESNEYRVDLLNPNIVKIDRSLIREYCTSLNSFLPDLVKRLYSKGYTIVLEGIENSQEHNALQFMCHSLVQGFHYGRPVDMKALCRHGCAISAYK